MPTHTSIGQGTGMRTHGADIEWLETKSSSHKLGVWSNVFD